MEFRDTFFGRRFKANPSCKLKPKSSSSAVLFNFICAVLNSPFSLKTILASLAIVLQQTIMYVCMCVCMYACMYVCLFICLSVGACVRVCENPHMDYMARKLHSFAFKFRKLYVLTN